MVQAFDVLRFDDTVLHGVVLTLDRYYARQTKPIEVTSIQRVLLSAVCTEMKLSCTDEFPPAHWQRVLDHLCRGRLSLAEILQTEVEVLERLDWIVGVPTPVTFLREFGIRLQGAALGSASTQGTARAEAAFGARCSSLALFLLELSLFEPSLEYGFSHTLLAAGAVSAALRTLDAEDDLREILLEDLATYCPDVPHLEELVQTCEEALLELWAGCSSGSSPWGEFYIHLEAKFASQAHHSVARLSPPTALRRLRATCSTGSGLSCGHMGSRGCKGAATERGDAALAGEVNPQAGSRAMVCL
jgi:hypothetical protein